MTATFSTVPPSNLPSKLPGTLPYDLPGKRGSSRIVLLVALSAGFAVLSTMPLRAQIEPPQSLLDAFSVRTATVQQIQGLPIQAGASFTTHVVLDGQRHTLDLSPHDIRAPGFRLLVDGPDGLEQVPTPASVTYRGTVAGHHDSTVAAALIDGQLQALIISSNTLWVVQPASDGMPGLPPTMHIVFRASDTVHTGVWCGNTEITKEPVSPPLSPLSFSLKEAEIAIDADYDYYLRYGQNVTTVQNRVTSIMNGVDAIYQRDVTIQYRITTIIVRTATTYTTTNMSTLLSQFRTRWNSQHGGVPRALAHLFTGVGSFS